MLPLVEQLVLSLKVIKLVEYKYIILQSCKNSVLRLLPSRLKAFQIQFSSANMHVHKQNFMNQECEIDKNDAHFLFLRKRQDPPLFG